MHRKDLPLVLISVSSILSGVAALWGDPSFWGKVIFILCLIIWVAAVWMIYLNHKNKR